MSENKKLTETGRGLAPPSGSGILDQAYKSLTAEQKKNLLAKAGEQALDQEIKDREAQRKFQAAGVEMARHVQLVEEHEKLKADFTVTSHFDTASGKTTVTVSKSNNTLIIVIAVVVAVVFFVVFAR